eukprot:93612-Chlamydomonas_euryale.AAC.2
MLFARQRAHQRRQQRQVAVPRGCERPRRVGNVAAAQPALDRACAPRRCPCVATAAAARACINAAAQDRCQPVARSSKKRRRVHTRLGDGPQQRRQLTSLKRVRRIACRRCYVAQHRAPAGQRMRVGAHCERPRQLRQLARLEPAGCSDRPRSRQQRPPYLQLPRRHPCPRSRPRSRGRVCAVGRTTVMCACSALGSMTGGRALHARKRIRDIGELLRLRVCEHCATTCSQAARHRVPTCALVRQPCRRHRERDIGVLPAAVHPPSTSRTRVLLTEMVPELPLMQDSARSACGAIALAAH